MPAKFLIALALTVLLGALASGNPFLPPPREGRVPEAPPVSLISLRSVLSSPRGLASPSGFAVQSGIALRNAAGERVLLPCPVPALQPLVVEVRFDAEGAPSWVLQDGRVLRDGRVSGPDAVPASAAAGP